MDIKRLIEFKNWADNIYLEYIENLSEEEFENKILGKSIKDILTHIYEVYWSWYVTMTTKDHSSAPLFDELPKNDLIEGTRNINRLLLSYAETGDINKQIPLKWAESDKQVITNPENILMNSVTHSAYHRGQIAIKLRQLGLQEITETDFNPYIYELGQK